LARRARKRRANAPASRPPRPVGPARRPDTSPEAGTTNGRAREPERSGETMARGYARSRERDEAARAALVPLAPGERPWPIVVCAVLAVVFAVANVVLVLAGWEVDGDRPVVGGLVFAAIMLAAAIGMWHLKYWAVLGFEVLLGVTFAGAMLSILRATNLEAVLLSVGVMLLTGPLFWLLIRQMARIQMPARGSRRES
jgi:hypothetical protein